MKRTIRWLRSLMALVMTVPLAMPMGSVVCIDAAGTPTLAGPHAAHSHSHASHSCSGSHHHAPTRDPGESDLQQAKASGDNCLDVTVDIELIRNDAEAALSLAAPVFVYTAFDATDAWHCVDSLSFLSIAGPPPDSAILLRSVILLI